MRGGYYTWKEEFRGRGKVREGRKEDGRERNRMKPWGQQEWRVRGRERNRMNEALGTARVEGEGEGEEHETAHRHDTPLP